MSHLWWHTRTCRGDCKIKSREELMSKGHTCQWFSNVYVLERFKLAKITFDVEHDKMSLKQNCGNEHVITKMYKHLLKFETEKEKVKGCMKELVGYNTEM